MPGLSFGLVTPSVIERRNPVPVYPGIIAVIRATYSEKQVLECLAYYTQSHTRTLNEHDLEIGVGIGKTSGRDTARWTTTVGKVSSVTGKLRARRAAKSFRLPANYDIDFLWVTHDVSAGKDEQLSECKNRDENLERGWGSFILLSPFMSH